MIWSRLLLSLALAATVFIVASPGSNWLLVLPLIAMLVASILDKGLRSPLEGRQMGEFAVAAFLATVTVLLATVYQLPIWLLTLLSLVLGAGAWMLLRRWAVMTASEPDEPNVL